MPPPLTVLAWDPRKADLNELAHGVGFDEATSAFFDAQALLIPDPDHSAREDRFVLLGASARSRLLVACHCYREQAHVIRIISAREATRAETARYACKEQFACEEPSGHDEKAGGRKPGGKKPRKKTGRRPSWNRPSA